MRTSNGAFTKNPQYHMMVKQFSTIDFYDQEAKRHIIILYALTEDGVIHEFVNGKWTPFPITEENLAPTPAKV